jgi:amino acid transporter
MGGLDIFALLVIILLIAVVIWLVVLLGSLPGNIARKRDHPQAEAINVLGWIGIITMGLSWFVAITWAYYKPNSGSGSDEALKARVKDLENRLQQMKAGGSES